MMKALMKFKGYRRKLEINSEKADHMESANAVSVSLEWIPGVFSFL